MTQDSTQQADTKQPAKPIHELFHGMVEAFIDEKGMETSQGICLTKDGEVEIASLMCPPEQCYMWLLCMAGTRPDITEIMVGMDRYTKPGQGNEFGDTIAGIHWTRVEEKKGTFKGFVIDYQFAPEKIVRPVNYDNHYWNEILKNEIQHIAASLMSMAAKRRMLEEHLR